MRRASLALAPHRGPARQDRGVTYTCQQDTQPAQPGRMVPRKIGRVLGAVAVTDGGQHVEGQQEGQGIDPAPGIPVVRDGLQVGHEVVHQPMDRCGGEGVELWDNDGHEGCEASARLYDTLRTQNGPLCYGNGLGTRITGLDPIYCIRLFIPHACSALTQGSGRGQATAGEVANRP